jgi:hypothetical protein
MNQQTGRGNGPSVFASLFRSLNGDPEVVLAADCPSLRLRCGDTETAECQADHESEERG